VAGLSACTKPKSIPA
jgi:lipoprotein-anchoring transpeptidase ErfK/SrfK